MSIASWENLRHEHRGPVTLFSVAAFSQEQFKADFSPQEHFASLALEYNNELFAQTNLRGIRGNIPDTALVRLATACRGRCHC